MKKKIILISDLPEDAAFLSEIISIVDADLEVAPDAKTGLEFLAENECEAIFLDITRIKQLREFEVEAQQRFGLFSDRLQPNQIHFIGNGGIGENRDAILSPLFGSFLPRSSESVEMNGQLYGRFVKAGENMNTNGVEHYISAKGDTQEVVITNSNQKQDAAEAVRQFLLMAKIPARISNGIANAVDELLMNALFDAPCDQFGKPLYSATSRSLARELKAPEHVSLKIGFDGFCVGISVSDSFGSVDRNRLLSHVSMNYRDHDYKIKFGQAGAGLGIATVFNSGGTLIYHCETHVKTIATLLYRAYPNYRDFKSQFKFFSARFYG